MGEAETLRHIGEPLRSGIARVLGPSGGSRTWTSVTPFVAPRFLKKRGTNSLEGQIKEALAPRHLPPARVDLLDLHSEPSLSFRHFVLGDERLSPPVRLTHALRLTFDTPVEGPICLGYGSHYGLGRFGAALAGDDRR